MGWDISLRNERGIVVVPLFCEGGTQVVGGSTEASISVTYNYSPYYYCFFDKDQGIRWLHNKPAKECIERFDKAIKLLSTKPDDDYWKQTPGNAGHILAILRDWAHLHPEAIFEVE